MMSEETDQVPEHPDSEKDVEKVPENSAENEGKNDEEKVSSSTDDWLSLSSWTATSSSWLQQAKDKTVSTLEMMKKDLGEFSEVVQTEASHLASATASQIKEQAKNLEKLVADDEDETEETNEKEEEKLVEEVQVEGTSNEKAVKTGGSGWMQMDWLLETVNKALYIEDTTKDEKVNEIPITSENITITQPPTNRLYAIQTDPGTYRSEPDGAPELFDDWLDHQFRLEEKKPEISQLLATNPGVRTLYAQLVPSEMSNGMFWQRYFYRVHQFELDEARRQTLLERNTDKEPIIARTSWGDSEGDGELAESAETVVLTKSGDEEHKNDAKTESTETGSDEAWSLCSTGEEERTKTPTGDTVQKEKQSDDWIDWEEQ